jgi:hypothetical protein
MLRYVPRTTVWLLSLLVIMASLLIPWATRSVQAAITETPVPLVTGNVEEWSSDGHIVWWAENCFAEEFATKATLTRSIVLIPPVSSNIAESIDDGARCNTYRNQLASSYNAFDPRNGVYYFSQTFIQNQEQGQIIRMPRNAPFTPQVIKQLNPSEYPVDAFVEAGGYLYWIAFSGNKILRTLQDGSGNIETVADTAASPTDAIVVGNTVYWADSTGIFGIGISCASLPCTDQKQQFDDFGANTSAHGLLYQSLPGGGVLGNSYRIYWVERVTSGVNSNYKINYVSCNSITICFVLPPVGQVSPPPPNFYTATPNWRIGNLILANNNIYWTEADQTTVNNNNGDVKRRAYDATAPGADTIATGQAKIDDQIYLDSEFFPQELYFARQNTGVYSLPLNAQAITRDFKADSLEVTQVVQDLANNTPLIATRTTYVRAYGRQISGPSAPNVEARLVATQNGVPLPGSPLQPINGVRALTLGGSNDRALLKDSWYFRLPSNWTNAGNISLQLEIDPRHIHTDPNLADNAISKTVTFQNQPPVCVWTVPVRTHNPRPSTKDPNFPAMVNKFKQLWPVPDVWVYRDTNPVEELEVCWYGPFPHPCYGPYELTDGWGITNGIPDRDKVIVSLWARALLTFNPDACDNIGAPTHFMGMVHPDANTGNVAGYASTVSSQSWVKLPGHVPNPLPAGWNFVPEGSTMAQELAHNHGRKHVDCGGPDDIDTSYPYPPCNIDFNSQSNAYGFDVTTLQPIRPTDAADFMSYASRTWVSPYTFKALFNKFMSTSVASTAPDEADAGNSVFVTGLVDTENNRGEITLVLVLPTESVPPGTRQSLRVQVAGVLHDDGPHAVFKLRLLDSGGTVLEERILTLTPLDDHTPDGSSAMFSDLFAQPAGQVATVQLLADDTVIDTITPGVNPPTVAVQQPSNGAVIDNNLTIEWTASDPDPDDRLLFTVQYSHDNGTSWHTIALNRPGTDTPNNALTLDDLGSLHGSETNTALVRVLATDGYNTATATSQPFTVKNRLPQPMIVTPGNTQTFAAGEAVLLRGSATDPEDGGLSGSALTWQVNGVGSGSGTDVNVAGLAPGSHTAALSATDANGQTAASNVTFNVAPLDVPEATGLEMDGLCDDPSYATGANLQLKPYGDGTQANVRLLRSGDYLWACFSGLKGGEATAASYVGVYADIDNSHDALAQPADAGFFAAEDGSVFTLAGDGAGNLIVPGPGGLQAVISASETTWNAELRIEKAKLGGWDHLVGLSLSHRSVAVQDDAHPWPYTSEATEPNTWATTALGYQPVITLLSPATAPALGASFAMTVEGSGFVAGTVALWDGAELPTTYVDSEHLTVQVDAAKLASAALAQVKTRAPNNFESNQLPFLVEGTSPMITSLSPASVAAGSPALVLTINGSNFAPDAQVFWNGSPLATQFVNGGQVTVQVDAALLANGQTVGVAVNNPQPDSAVSPVVNFEIQPATQSGTTRHSYLPMLSTTD